MRKRHFLAVLAGVALASCVTDKEYVPKLEEQVRIAFGSPVMYESGNETRANVKGEIGTTTYGETTRTYPHEEDFRIFAVKYDVGQSFAGWAKTNTNTVENAMFNGAKATYNSSLDGWVPVDPTDDDAIYYWPADKKLAYAAYSPYDLQQGNGWDNATNVTYGKEGLTITDFKVPATTAEQFDLMFSKRRVDVTKASMQDTPDKYSGAPIEFQHALSSIHFSLKNEDPATEIVLTKISVYGVYDKGTFTENIDESKGFDYVRTDNDTDKINVSPRWEVDTRSTVSLDDPYIAFDATGTNPSTGRPYEGLPFPESIQYISAWMAENANAGENHVMLVMPQTIPNTAKLRIDYTVNNGENTVNAHKEVSLLNAVKWDKVNQQLTTEGVTSWEMGTKYTYRLVYSSNAAKQDKIYFAPSTEGWRDAITAVIDLAQGATTTPVTPAQ